MLKSRERLRIHPVGIHESLGAQGESFNQEAVCIDWLDVHPGFQGGGIARQLLSKAEERERARGLSLLFMHTSLENLAMINFASKNGFKFEKYLKEFWVKEVATRFS